MRAILVVFSLMFVTSAVAETPRPYPGFTKTDMSKIAVDTREIRQGCPRKDCIPAVDDPVYVPASEITVLGEKEPVMRLEINGDLRAYPLRALMFHEIVNDTVGGVPVSVTFCPLCNSAIVFDRNVGNDVLDFGVSGLLRNSDLIMYDRQTESLWQQFEGRSIIGAYADEKLAMIPIRLEAFGTIKAESPDAKVFVPGSEKRLGEYFNPYTGYDSSARPFLYSGPLPNGIPAMERVVKLRDESPARAYSFSHLANNGPVKVDGISVAMTGVQTSALDGRDIASSREVATVTATNEKGEDVVHDIIFAFVFHAFFPDGEIVHIAEN